MNFVAKIIGTVKYGWTGDSCRKDLTDGMSDKDLIRKYGEYTVSKVKDTLDK